MKIKPQGGQLVLQWECFAKPLKHYCFDTFTLPIDEMDNPLVGFPLDAKGTVARVKVLGHMGVEFQRRR